MNTGKYAIGKCKTMCPVEEMEMRQKEKLLHVFEMVPGTQGKNPVADPERAVKMYNRSAAGKSMTNENNLRPPEVLLKTVNYLLEKVIRDKKSSWLTKYDFIADRLRAVRQDMIIQSISPTYSISLLEPMVRFHAYSAYKYVKLNNLELNDVHFDFRLCDHDIYKFDPHLNKKTLQECLNNLLILYDQVEQSSSSEYDELFAKNMKKSRLFYQALNIILNLGNEETLLTMIGQTLEWRTSPLNTATLISLNYIRGNFVKVCRYIRDLTPLLATMAVLNLPAIRRKALQMMSVAYSSKNMRFPLSVLQDLLIYESEEELVKDCKHYGLEIQDKSVCFDKNSFKSSAEEIPPRKSVFLEENFRNIDESSMLMFGEDATVGLIEKMERINIF